MSSAMVSAAAAQGRLFFSGNTAVPEVSPPPAKFRGDVPHPATSTPRESFRQSCPQSYHRPPARRRNLCLASGSASGPGNAFQRHRRHQRAYRRLAARLSHRNLRPCLFRTHHRIARRLGRSHPPRRILRPGRRQRRSRSPLRRRCRRGFRPPALGPLRRRCSPKITQTRVPRSRAPSAREVGIFSQPAFHLDRTSLKRKLI